MTVVNRRSGMEFAESPKREGELPARQSVHELRFLSAAGATLPMVGAGAGMRDP